MNAGEFGHPLSWALMVMMAIMFIWSAVYVDSFKTYHEFHLRLLALVLGLPLAAILAIEGIVHEVIAASVVSGVVGFALGRYI